MKRSAAFAIITENSISSRQFVSLFLHVQSSCPVNMSDNSNETLAVDLDKCIVFVRCVGERYDSVETESLTKINNSDTMRNWFHYNYVWRWKQRIRGFVLSHYACLGSMRKHCDMCVLRPFSVSTHRVF